MRWTKTTRLWGDSRPHQQWETEGYFIRKNNITGPGVKNYRANTVEILHPKAKWGSCGPVGMKVRPIGPYRRYLAEAKADVEAHAQRAIENLQRVLP